jgi:hypothetical protein
MPLIPEHPASAARTSEAKTAERRLSKLFTDMEISPGMKSCRWNEMVLFEPQGVTHFEVYTTEPEQLFRANAASMPSRSLREDANGFALGAPALHSPGGSTRRLRHGFTRREWRDRLGRCVR